MSACLTPIGAAGYRSSYPLLNRCGMSLRNRRQYMTCDRVSQSACLLLLLGLGTQASFGQGFGGALGQHREYRSSNFSECHASLRVITELGDDLRERDVTVWVKGDRIRNDIARPDGRTVGVINGDTCISVLQGMNSLTICDTSENPDMWQFLGLVHPGSIGATRTVLDVYRNGKHPWLLESALVNPGIEFTGGYDSSKDSTVYSAELQQRIPVGFTNDEMKKAGSFDAYLKQHPDAETFDVKVAYQVQFSAEFDGQLVSFHQKQSALDGSNATDVKLFNVYTFDNDSQLWFPSSSSWEVQYNGKLVEKRTVEVSSIDFSGVDDKVFTVDGLGFADGTVVSDRRATPRSGVIQNGKLRLPKVVSPVRSTPLTARNKMSKKIFVGINLILMSVVLIILVFRKRWQGDRKK